jgi:hypothetical protein
MTMVRIIIIVTEVMDGGPIEPVAGIGRKAGRCKPTRFLFLDYVQFFALSAGIAGAGPTGVS